jgi:hypothetical protein
MVDATGRSSAARKPWDLRMANTRKHSFDVNAPAYQAIHAEAVAKALAAQKAETQPAEKASDI